MCTGIGRAPVLQRSHHTDATSRHCATTRRLAASARVGAVNTTSPPFNQTRTVLAPHSHVTYYVSLSPTAATSHSARVVYAHADPPPRLVLALHCHPLAPTASPALALTSPSYCWCLFTSPPYARPRQLPHWALHVQRRSRSATTLGEVTLQRRGIRLIVVVLYPCQIAPSFTQHSRNRRITLIYDFGPRHIHISVATSARTSHRVRISPPLLLGSNIL